MEPIEGSTLDFEWGLLSTQQKDSISAQLRVHLNQIRSIPSPGYYGSIGRRGLLDCIFWTGDDACAPLDGPFDTEHALNEAMRSKFIYNDLSPAKAEFYRVAFPAVLQGHPPVFTHGDLQRKNIIIRRIPAVSPSTGAQLRSDAEDLQEQHGSRICNGMFEGKGQLSVCGVPWGLGKLYNALTPEFQVYSDSALHKFVLAA
jgi:hypothetical protein